ncbi:general substrate transporter [Scheffersomyces coipomensis]|uniref:general substrate transporter n=1 Tax=Scheffersomyces coipomensis TaxID=1788519 RepID=UPI00315D09FC
MSQQALTTADTTPVQSHTDKESEDIQPVQAIGQALPEKGFKDYILISFFCLLVAFGGFVFGFDTGTIGGFLNMSDFQQRFGELNEAGNYTVSDIRTGLIVSVFNVGCCIGGLFLSKIAEIYGRRIGLMFSMVIYIVGIAVQISSQYQWYQVMVGRIISGLAVGTVSVLSPMFISETAPKSLRGPLVCCFQLCITLGIFLGYCICYGTKDLTDSKQWRIPLGLCFLWALFLIVGMVFMPESPRYLVEKSRIDEAKKSIARSNKVESEDPFVYNEVHLIQAGIDREALAGSASWMELITGKPAIFRRVIMGITLTSLQQLTGINYFFYYGTTIFQAVGLEDSFQTSIILGTVNFVSTFAGIWAIERLGRRVTLLIGSVFMFICLLIYSCIGSINLYRADGSTNQTSGNVMIFITCVYIFFFASTWAGGCYTIISETYPLRIRAKAMAVATGANWMLGFLISMLTPMITKAINFYFGFVFSGSMLVSCFFVYFFVCETKGLTLEEVDQLYAARVAPWKSTNWVPPTEEEVDA